MAAKNAPIMLRLPRVLARLAARSLADAPAAAPAAAHVPAADPAMAPKTASAQARAVNERRTHAGIFTSRERDVPWHVQRSDMNRQESAAAYERALLAFASKDGAHPAV
jgi:hypothetical protein